MAPYVLAGRAATGEVLDAEEHAALEELLGELMMRVAGVYREHALDRR